MESITPLATSSTPQFGIRRRHPGHSTPRGPHRPIHSGQTGSSSRRISANGGNTPPNPPLPQASEGNSPFNPPRLKWAKRLLAATFFTSGTGAIHAKLTMPKGERADAQRALVQSKQACFTWSGLTALLSAWGFGLCFPGRRGQSAEADS
jgi:hypothetical protein